MVVDLKEKQPVNMMPGGVGMHLSWATLIEALHQCNTLKPNEFVTHVGSDLTGLTIRVERR